MPDSIFSKTVPELQRWAAKERLDHRKLNKPVEAINTMVRGVGGPHQPSMVARPSVSAEPATTVVLVEAPLLPDPPEEPGSPILKIRRVAYADPPVPEQYEWDGEAFDAYPAFGLKVADFVGLEWLPAGEGVPDVDETVFLKARLVDDFWLVDKPAAVVAQFRFITLSREYLIGRFFDGDTVGTEDIKIAKPYKLRTSTYDGRTWGGIRYDHVFNYKRSARNTETGETETQIIVEPYRHNDLIYATAYVKGGVDVISSGTSLLWLDDNRDGRAWAAEFEEEVASVSRATG